MKMKTVFLSVVALAMALTSCDVFGGPNDQNKGNSQEDTSSAYEYTSKDIRYYTKAGDVICNLRSGNKTRTIKKSYDGFCAVALANIGDYFGPVLVGEDRIQVCYETDADSPSYSTSYGTIEYQGKTYYYSKGNLFLLGNLTEKEQYSNYFSQYNTAVEVAKDVISKAIFNPVPEEAKKKFLYKELDDGTLSIYAGPYLMGEKEIIIPATFNGKKVSKISAKGFKDLKSLEKLSFESGSTIKTIESSAFSDCSNLKRVIIPENVENIGSYAFSSCSKELMIFCEKEEIPSSYYVDRWNDYAAWYGSADKIWKGTIGYLENDSFLYGVRINNNLIVCKYFKNDESLTIPDAYENHIVEEIGRKAFEEKKRLKNIILPKGLKNIYSEAFLKCTQLAKVDFPAGTLSIGSASFEYCSSLKFVTIPDSVKTIGSYAFCQCSDELMIYCEVESSPSGYYYDSWNDYSAWYGSAYAIWYGTTGYIESPDYVFGLKIDGTLSISKYKGTNKEVQIPSNYDGKTVTSIASSCFQGKNKILSVGLPNTIRKISDLAFKGCTQLSFIKIPAGVETIGDGAFRDCSSLKFVTIPDTVKNIGSRAFDDCNDDLIIFCEAPSEPSGYYTSSTNSGLNWKNVGTKAWFGVRDYIVESDYVYGAKLDGNLIITKYNGTSNSVTIPETCQGKSIDQIGLESFAGKNKIKTLTMSSKITKIGGKAFYGCTQLQKIELSSNLKLISQQAFANCSNLPYIIIPASVETIDYHGFYNLNSDFVIYCEASSKPDGFYYNKYNASSENWNGGYKYYFRSSWKLINGEPTKV